VSRDIDSAAKFIGAGAATVGIAGSGILNCIMLKYANLLQVHNHCFFKKKKFLIVCQTLNCIIFFGFIKNVCLILYYLNLIFHYNFFRNCIAFF